jgi:hypothetical protein
MESPSADQPPAFARVLPYLAALVLLLLVVRNAWVTEDAYITLRTVDNWVSGHGLRWNVDERVQGYTHPLWMGLLSAVYALTREAFFSTAGLGIAVTGAALQVPRSASRAGFERLELRPLGGDGWYGAGALSLGGEPVWASKDGARAPD